MSTEYPPVAATVAGEKLAVVPDGRPETDGVIVPVPAPTQTGKLAGDVDERVNPFGPLGKGISVGRLHTVELEPGVNVNESVAIKPFTSVAVTVIVPAVNELASVNSSKAHPPNLDSVLGYSVFVTPLGPVRVNVMAPDACPTQIGTNAEALVESVAPKPSFAFGLTTHVNGFMSMLSWKNHGKGC